MAKKKIKILTRGPISVKGYIWGPVLTPYDEEVDVIFKMISAGIKVVEVTETGDVELTIQSLNNSDNKKLEEKVRKTEAKLMNEKIEKAKKSEEAKKIADEEAKKSEEVEAERLEKIETEKKENEKNDVKEMNNNKNNKKHK